MSQLAYYAHSHGSGHCRYADFVSSLIPGGIPVMTTPDYPFRHAAEVIKLGSEDVADAVRARYLIDVPDYLHYSPVDLPGIRSRSLRILQAIEERGIDLVIVDVSVEVAALLRASSVPYLYVKMPGHRNDLPHLAAYRGAMGLIAYYPAELEGPETPDWVKEKTAYLGFKAESADSAAAPEPVDLPGLRDGVSTICVVKGFGGGEEVDRAVGLLRQRFPQHYLIGLGDFPRQAAALLDHRAGVVTSVTPYLRRSDVVVGACGSNLTAEIVGLGKPFVCLPCPRPFDEQEAIATALRERGLAISLTAFLAGDRPPVPTAATRAHFGRQHYAAYFRRLAAAADWREVLHPHLLTSPSTTGETV